jgi:hypothetical protein
MKNERQVIRKRVNFLSLHLRTLRALSRGGAAAIHPCGELRGRAVKVGTVDTTADARDGSLVRVLPKRPVRPSAGHGRRGRVAADPQRVIRAHAAAAGLGVPAAA